MKNTMKMMVTVAALTSIAGGMTALATGEKDSATTNGKVNFTIGGLEGGTLPPTHPEEKPSYPIKPGEPGEPGGQGLGGSLSLDFAPGFNFDVHEVSTSDEEYSAKLITDTNTNDEVANFAQVSDRRGTSEGWELSLIQESQFKTADGLELNGAELHLKNSTYFSMMPDATAATVTNEQDLKITPQSSSILMEANEGKGMGSHTIRFGSMSDGTATDAVTLKVPGTAIQYADKEYTTNLDWTVNSKPGNIEN